ncbi:TPMT family class I SAM-dependent methyltransferase [Flavobacteriaceae bacterium GSB9]|nr:TPMT family class I SAM-dependent methyltransferase [Flavobacteriaceae bacterium GSB9]
MDLSEAFWDNRYINGDTGWDLGNISPPLKLYIDQLTDKSLKILIPGGGNSYEAEYLQSKEFKNVFVADISKTALNNISQRVENFPKDHLIHKDFFELKQNFDIILEQTFFCAINPNLRPKYAKKINELLASNGKIVGLLFNVPLNQDQPPFGGNKQEYINYFKPYFDIEIMELSYNSHSSRMGRELFFKMTKRDIAPS